LSIAGSGFNIAAMAAASKPRIAVELEPGADPIRGLVEHADGRRQPFWGWLELIDELRRAAEVGDERTQEVEK
jgi:hypothetical protein